MAGTKTEGGGAGEAFALHLFLAMRGDLTRYLRSILAEGEEVDDILQESWVRFAAACASARAILEPRALLFRIARNLAMDGHRRRRAEHKIFTSDTPEITTIVPSDLPSAHAQLESSHELAAIREAIARLPERTRRAFLLHRVEGLKLVDIATRLGISKSLAQHLVVGGLEACRTARRRARQVS